MIGQKIVFLIVIMLFPLFAFAHGEEVLVPLLIQLGSILIFVVLLATIKLPLAGKLVLALSYFLTLCIIFFFTWDVPYRKIELSWTYRGLWDLLQLLW